MPIITNSTITKRWTAFYGQKVVNDFQYYNKTGITSFIRINYLKTDDQLLLPELESKGFQLAEIGLPGCYKVIKNRISLGATNEFLFGHYAIQGLASQFVAHVINPKPDDTILDMSAAPGGKTAHLASLMNNKGLILAIDSSKPRLTALRSNLARLDVQNVLAIQADSTELPPSFGEFTKILLDAPCTGSGSICKRPKDPWNKNLDDIERLAKKQEHLLDKAVKLLKPGGELIFSTCSIEPEEGEQQIERLVTKFQQSLSIVDISELNTLFENSTVKQTNIKDKFLQENQHKWLRITPNEDYEGFFICKLRKKKD